MRSERRIALSSLLALTACTMDFEQFRGRDAAHGSDVRPDPVDDVPAVEDIVDGSMELDATDAMDAVPGTDAMDAPDRAAPDAMDVVDATDATDVRPDVPAQPDVPPDVPVVTDTGPATGCTTPYTPSAAGTAPCMTLRVNEVQTQGALGGSDEFVEIYNAGSCAVTLTGWTVRYSSSTGGAPSIRWTGAVGNVVASGGYALVGGEAFACTNVLGRFAGSTGSLSATAGGIGLFDPGGTRVDSVAYGSGAPNPLVEGSPTLAPPVGQSIGRDAYGTDSNSNVADFTVRAAPTPGAPDP